MRWQTFRTCAERLSFFLWIAFTILSISLAGVGIEGVILALLMWMASSAVPVHFPVAMVVLGGFGVGLSIFWRQVGIDHFHYLLYDSVGSFGDDADAPSSILRELINEVEASAGLERTEARAKAKRWLIGHVSSLDGEDIQLARAHFGYLLPAGWGGGK